MRSYRPRALNVFASVALLSFSLIFAAAAGAKPPPVEITECGQRVVGTGFLTGDLDCSAADVSFGVIFEKKRKGILELRGFSIIGPPGEAGLSSGANAAVLCERRCVILGQGGGLSGLDWGVQAVKRVDIYDLTVSGVARRAVDGRRVAKLYNTTITGSGWEALTGDRLRLENCVITNNALLTNNAGPSSPRPAVHGHAIRVFNSTITGNQGVGAEGIRARVKESVVINNSLHPSCGVAFNCNFDIGSMRRPRIKNTTCDYSFDASACGGCPGEAPLTDDTNPALHNWGVCALDPAP